jgi:hypothetical protein
MAWNCTKSHQPKGNNAKEGKVEELVDSKKDPPPYQKWTDEDERKLNHLETSEIDISETAVGRADCTFKREMCATFSRMSRMKRGPGRFTLRSCRSI